jgi:LL-diaminopimelate aminotransferase
MAIHISQRLAGLTGYAFAEIDAKVASLRASGARVIDFGVGDPSEPAPAIVREAVKRGVDARASSGYPSYVGSREYREAIACWTNERFQVSLDPEQEICATIGAKEAVFHFAEVVIDPGDVVLVPNPGYPPYSRGTRFAEGEVFYLPLRSERGFLPDLAAIPSDVLCRARLLWINYPNNPTGVSAPRSFFEEAAAFGKRHNIIVASDEAYTENYYGAPPNSILEVAREGVIAFQSLSKRSCMTGYRVGWIAGDREIVAAFKKLKTNIDSGTPTFIQDAAIAALRDESHVASLRALYRKKRDLIVAAFVAAGLSECRPAATLYVWQRVPEGVSSVDFAKALLDPAIAIAATPGNWISEPTPEGNPGEGFVRLALVPTLEECEEAARRIRTALPDILKR